MFARTYKQDLVTLSKQGQTCKASESVWHVASSYKQDLVTPSMQEEFEGI